MHEVSKAINNLDPNKGTIDQAICKTYTAHNDADQVPDTPGSCQGIYGANQGDHKAKYKALSHMFVKPSTVIGGGGQAADPLYLKDDSEKVKKMPQHTATTVSTDVSNLTRDQKGVVSSAFARAHEGAEIVNFLEEKTIDAKICAGSNWATNNTGGETYGKCSSDSTASDNESAQALWILFSRM